jgi:hypothetical protein
VSTYLKFRQQVLGKENLFLLLCFISSRIFHFSLLVVFNAYQGKDSNSFLSCRWDCWWYYGIIQDGYMDEVLTTGQVGYANWAFFPFYPELVKLLMIVSPVNSVATGIFLNNLMFIIFLYIMKGYLRNRFSNFDSKSFVFLYCFTPFTIYFNSLYTETCFIFLSALLLKLLYDQKYVLAGICGAFLSATRFAGVLMIGMFLLTIQSDREYFMQNKKRWISGFLVFPFGLIIFSAYLLVKTGDPFAFVTIQSAWGWGDSNLFHWVLSLPEKKSFREWSNFACLLAAIGVCGILFLKKMYIEFIVFLGPVLLSVTSTAISYRYYFALYPPYLLASILIGRNKRFRYIFFPVAVLGLVYFTFFWTSSARFLV